MLMFHSSPGDSESWWGGQRRPQPQHPNLGKVLHSAWMYRSVHSEWQENIPKPPCGPLLNWEVPLSSLAIILTPYWMFLYFTLCLPLLLLQFSQFSSVAQSCPTLCDPMDGSMPGLPVHHQLPEFTQTHVHWVGDAIQPSRPLSSAS